jgi:thiopeptide-type bacteriocin biosynthesis protein
MGRSMFRAAGAEMVRASACDPGLLPWPDADASRDKTALRAFIRSAWAVDDLAAAVELASPSLAAAVAVSLRGEELSAVRTARAAMALARYAVRMRGRATPFGLFAGVVPAQGELAGARHPGHRVAARADGQWLAALITTLEECAELRRRLRVTANDLVTVRGDRIIVAWLPHASSAARTTQLEVSLRRTPPAEAALRLAQAPVSVTGLAAGLAAEFADADPSRIDAMIGQLLACGALVSDLRPPSTVTDGLGHVLGVLGNVGVADLPGTAAATAVLTDMHSALAATSAADADRCADRMRALAISPVHPVAVDLYLSHGLTVAGRVAAEAATAASLLARLSPHPRGTEDWRDYHARFLERYGAGTAVMVRDLIDPVTGLGLPGHYAGKPDERLRAWSRRDERLAALAQQAALEGSAEVVLGDADITDLAGPAAAPVRPVPHADITVEVRAPGTEAVEAGEFTIVVCGTGRTGMATSGRFLHLLARDDRDRMARIYRALPTGTEAAVTAQLSFPPHHPRTENVARVPQLLPCVLSLAEHRDPGPDQIRLRDLAVTADLDRFYLLSVPWQKAVEPVLAWSPAWHAVPPVARMLFELPRMNCASVGLFDWGAAGCLPFLPRLRAGRVVLALARWRIRAGDLPGRKAGWGEWTAAVSAMRDRLRLPAWVCAGSGDRQLRLHLDDAMDLAVLRAHLETAADTIVLTESWAPHDHAWCGGRAHELVVPLASTVPPVPAPRTLTRRRPLPPTAAGHGYPPGSGVLSARLYTHPDLFDIIVTSCLPDLAQGWDELSRWWFLRYRDPHHHLRLRLHVRDYGQAAARAGRWAAELRCRGLAGDLLLDTYRPETARFGAGTAMSAAEELFAADSAAAAAQLGSAGTGDPRALTAASLADLAGAMLGDQHDGLRWLAARPRPAATAPLARDLRLQAMAMTLPGPGTKDAVPAAVRRAWDARADAAARYALQLGSQGWEPASVIASLLHLHHNRVHGPDPATEDALYKLARSAALSCTARHPTPAAGRS